MAPLYAMLSIAGWAFFIGLLGYLMFMKGRPSRGERSRGFDVLVKDDESKVS